MRQCRNRSERPTSSTSWLTSLKAEQAGIERADRWGIFVGEWAPTFIGLGLALSHYEQQEGTLTGSLHAVREAS
ncbi:hypothetical protein [Streptomyces sp. NPDC001068]|uniref:hypothetical protein n=1 Tax=Streptomyces sp. NPDC001068 TaxID=3364544 RepID=UPI003675F1B0